MLPNLLLPSLLLALAQGGSWRGRHGAGHLEEKYHSHGSHGEEHKHVHKHGGHGDRVLEQAAFSVLSREGGYETRKYPASVWVCTNMTVDTLADPLAGLEHMDIFQIRKSDRYRTKVASSLTFKRLYRYISGANDGGVEIAMTRGGYIRHSPILTSGPRAHQGVVELQERCLYLPSIYQGGEPVPEPTEPGVYIRHREEIVLYVNKLPGWVFTASSWQQAHRAALEKLETREKIDQDVYYTRNSGYHWIPENDRDHEVWVPQIKK